MKNEMKKAACGFMAAAVCLSGCGKLDGTQTVLTVNDSTLTLGTANVALRYQQSQMYSYYSQMYAMYGMTMDELWDTEVEVSEASETSETSGTSEASEASEASGSSVAEEAEDTGTGKTTTYGEQFKDSCLDNLTDMLLLAEHMGEYGVEFTEEDQAAAEDAAAAFVEANDGDILEADGITAEDVAEYLRLLTIQSRMFDPMVADVDTEVSDEEAKQSTITYISVLNSTYETDSDEEDADTEETEEEKSAAAKAQAKEVAERIYDAVKNSPADTDLTEVVAAIDADATVSTSTYGSTESSTGLDEAVREAADTLSDGEFYDGVIELDNAYWIIRMDAVLDREATDAEKENIVSTRKSDLYQEILDGWNDAASTTVNTSVWKKVKVTDSVVYTIKAAESTEE